MQLNTNESPKGPFLSPLSTVFACFIFVAFAGSTALANGTIETGSSCEIFAEKDVATVAAIEQATQQAETDFHITREDRASVDKAFEQVDRINNRQRRLGESTDQLLGRASDEARLQKIDELEFFMRHDSKSKVLRAIQSSFVEMEHQVRYFDLDNNEFQTLLHKKPLNLFERMRFMQLQFARSLQLSYIGRNFLDHRETLKMLNALKDGSNKTLSEDADWVLRNLGLSKSYIARFPVLLKTRIPTEDHIAGLFSGTDPMLAPFETATALNALTARDLRVQQIENFVRRIASVASDDTLFGFFKTAIDAILPGEPLSELLPTEETGAKSDAYKAVARLGRVAYDAYAISEHYPGIRKLITSEMPIKAKFELFMQLNSHYGIFKNGLPSFMITMVRRDDAFAIWDKLKSYVKKSRPDYVMGVRGRTLLQTMNRAEELRALGMLPSVFNPRKATSFRAAGTGLIAAAIISASFAAYDAIFEESPIDTAVHEFEKVMGLDTPKLKIYFENHSGDKATIIIPMESKEKTDEKK